MASVNKAILLGYLGKDPAVRYLPDGKAVANVSMATSESWTDKATSEKKESTQWHQLVFYGRLAEIAGEYLKKGSPIYVEGKIQTRKYQDKDGHDRYVTEIVCHEMKMLGGKPEGESKPAGADYAAAKSGERPAAKPAPEKAGPFDHMEDDVPF